MVTVTHRKEGWFWLFKCHAHTGNTETEVRNRSPFYSRYSKMADEQETTSEYRIAKLIAAAPKLENLLLLTQPPNPNPNPGAFTGEAREASPLYMIEPQLSYQCL